jgi:hypothetical protein
MRAVLRTFLAVLAALLTAPTNASLITMPADPFEHTPFVTVTEAWEDAVWRDSDGLGRVPPLVIDADTGEFIGGFRFEFHQPVISIRLTAEQVGKCGPTEDGPDTEFQAEGISWVALRENGTIIRPAAANADGAPLPRSAPAACHDPYVVQVPDMLDLATLLVGGGSDSITEMRSWQFNVASVAGPPSAALMCIGMVALLMVRRRPVVEGRRA